MRMPRLCLFLLLTCLMLRGAHAAAPALPWQPGVTFSRTSVDDDVRNVLRALLGAQGLSVVFRPGITGKVSARFRDADASAVFRQITDENGLETIYDATTRTVTVGPLRTGPAATQRLIPLRGVDYGSLRQMLSNFGIGTEGITYDPALSMLGVTGDASRVAQVAELAKALEDHMMARQDRTSEVRQRAAVDQRTAFQARTYEDALNVQTRVFRLRFADVAPTTRRFNGRSVTIPGVLDTLQAMLGLPSAAAPTAQQTGYAPFRPAAPLRQLQAMQGVQPVSDTLPVTNEMDEGRGGAASIGRPAISVDQRTNSVIVRGSPAAIAAVDEVLKRIDQPVKMVQIEVVIATAQVGVSEEIGIAFRGGGRNGAFDTGTSGGKADAGSGFDPLSLLPLAAGPQGAVASFVLRGGQAFLQTQLKLLAQNNRARILSAPHLVTLDNTAARITRSEDLYVPVDTGGLNGQGLSQIQTGLTLEITPSIVPPTVPGAEQLVRLSLNAVNSAPSPGRQITVRSQEVQTDVLVPDGATFVVGGLFDDTRLTSRSGVPFLKDIPLLGALFRDTAEQASLGETIFFITPRVLEQREVLSRDVALAAGAPAHVAAQRRVLTGAAQEMDGRTGRVATRLLEEEE